MANTALLREQSLVAAARGGDTLASQVLLDHLRDNNEDVLADVLQKRLHSFIGGIAEHLELHRQAVRFYRTLAGIDVAGLQVQPAESAPVTLTQQVARCRSFLRKQRLLGARVSVAASTVSVKVPPPIAFTQELVDLGMSPRIWADRVWPDQECAKLSQVLQRVFADLLVCARGSRNIYSSTRPWIARWHVVALF